MPRLNWVGEDAVAKHFHTLHAMRFLHIDSQALAQQFNDDEEVWRAFERSRLIRRILGELLLIPKKLLEPEHADWLEAERSRPVRAIGVPFHQ